MKQLSIYEADYLEKLEAQADHGETHMDQIDTAVSTVSQLPCNFTQPLEEKAISSANVTEIIIAKNKADSIQMLLPMLNNLSQEKRWLAWIDPPIQLLKQWQETYSELAMEEIMILRSSESNSAFELSKKALEAGTCHAVIAWTDLLSNSEFEALGEASALGNSHGIFLRSR